MAGRTPIWNNRNAYKPEDLPTTRTDAIRNDNLAFEGKAVVRQKC